MNTMPDFNENIRLLSLDLFDAAFPVPPEDEESTKRRFMTLFEHEAHRRRGGNSTVSRVTNLYGETFAMKRLHVASADGSVGAGALAQTPQGTPARKELRHHLQSTSGSMGNAGRDASAAAAAAGATGAGAASATGAASAGATGADVASATGTASATRSGASATGSAGSSGTPDYVTQGHVFALYEEYRVHAKVSSLRGYPKLYGFGLMDGDPVIIMEWVEGILLRDCMKASGDPWPLQRVADLGIAVLTLLARTAELDESFVHRDLSPRNIILRTDRASSQEQLETGAFDVCLIDFGSSTLVGGVSGAFGLGADPTFTLNKNIWRMGTPSYAPPEMLSADIALPASWRRSQTIDTYALCSVLYELYSGRKPYRFGTSDTGSAASPYRVKTENPPEPLAPRDPDGGALANIIASGLSVQQADRPSVAELKAALENWKRLPAQRNVGRLRGAKPADAAFWQPGYARKARTRRAVIAAAIVAAAAVASGAIVAPKLATKTDALDPSRYPLADALYDGPPLFKAFDGEHPGWMLCASDGSIACKPSSSRECGALREGLVALYDDVSQRYGFITPASDGSGDYAWVVLPAYSQVSDFSEGLAAAQDPHTGLWGYIDAEGAWAIDPQFHQAASFSHGAAAVQVNATAQSSAAAQAGAAQPSADTALWGAIDPQGAWLLSPQFTALGSRDAAGHAVAERPTGGTPTLDASAQGNWGIIDFSGAWTCDPHFARMRSCAFGPAPAYDAETERWGFVALDGIWEIEPSFMDARPFYPLGEEGAAVLAAVQDPVTQLWYFIDEAGQPHQDMQPRFWKLGDLHDGLAPAQASPQDSVVEFDGANGPARVRGAGKRYGYVDATGAWHLKRLTTLTDTAIPPASL